MPRFVIGEHYARSHHFDLRLERDGVLVSWAVPKGMPTDPRRNRLAVRVDDHALSHLDFEDHTPVDGVPGAVRVKISDQGTYEAEEFGDKMVVLVIRGGRPNDLYAIFETGENRLVHLMNPTEVGGRH